MVVRQQQHDSERTAATYLLRKHLITDRQTWLILIAYPLAVVGVHFSTSLPVALALNSTQNLLITHIGAVITIGLSLFVTWIFAKALTLSNRVTQAVPESVAETAPVAEPELALSPS